MNKILVLFIYLFCSLKLFAKQNTCSVFVKEVDSFINATKSGSVFEGRYNLYVVNFFSKDTSDTSNNLCFSISYIRNSNDYGHISKSHYFELNSNETILLNVTDKQQELQLHSLGLKEISSQQNLPFLAKLLPKDEGTIVGIVEGEVCCISEDGFKKRFYENSDEIPYDYFIYNSNIWDRVKIEQVEDFKIR